MPHVIVKLFPGRSEQQKTRLAEQITKVVMAEAVCDESAVSVSIIDIAPERWTSIRRISSAIRAHCIRNPATSRPDRPESGAGVP